MEKQRKNASYKPLSVTIILLCILLVAQMPLVSASYFTFDNVKSFYVNEETSEYGKIEIRNSVLGIPFLQLDKVMELELKENTNYCFSHCEAKLTIKLYEDSILIDEMIFNRVGDEGQVYNYSIYYQTGLKDKDIPKYKEECNLIYDNLTKSSYEECKNVPNGMETVKVPNLTRYYIGQELPKGVYNVTIKGYKDFWSAQDWVISTQGVLTNEWALWTGSDAPYFAWKLDEGGTNVTSEDLSQDADQKNLTWINQAGNASWVDGIDGKALYFDGNKDFVQTVYQQIGNSTGEFSISYWFNMSDFSGRDTILHGIQGTSHNWKTRYGSNKIYFFVSSNANYVSTSPFVYDNNIWKHVLITYDGSGVGNYGKVKVYVNGTNNTGSNAGAIPASLVDKSYPIRLGGDSGSTWWKGNIDEVYIFNRTLSATEASDLWNAGAGEFFPVASNAAPNVTLTNPANASSTALNYINFTCEATDDSSMLNFSLYVDGTKETTVTNSSVGELNLSTFKYKTGLSYGLHYYYCLAWDFEGSSTNSSEYRVNVTAKAPTLNLTNPVDNYNTSIGNVTFNCSATDDSAVLNLTFVLDDSDNYTVYNTTPNQNLSLGIAITGLTYGTHNWSCNAWDDLDLYGASSTYDLTVDNQAPLITVTEPDGYYNYETIGQTNYTLNWSVTDLLLNQCWYQYSDVNYSVNCGWNTTEFNLTTDGNLTFWVNDSLGNINNSVKDWIIKIMHTGDTFDYAGVEGEDKDFKVNVTLGDSINFYSVKFVYNGTTNDANYTNSGQNYYFNKTYQLDEVGATANVSWYWEVRVRYLGGAILYDEKINITQNEITVSPLQAINITNIACAAGMFESINYTFYDEQNQTQYNADVQYNFKYGVGGSYDAKTANGEYLNTSILRVCINNTITSYKLGYGEVEYEIDNHVNRRYYMFSSQALSHNVTSSYNLSDLLTAEADSFQLTIQDNSLIPYEEKYVALNRWYPEDDTYNIVDMGLTDDEGQTVIKAEVEDVDYRIAIYHQNGTLIYLAQPIRMICASSPCAYVVTVPDTASDDWENFLGLDYSLTESNGIVTLSYSDPSQETDTIQLQVYRISGTSETKICEDNETDYAGVLTCNITAFSGEFKAVAKKASSPFIPIDVLLIDRATSVMKGTTGLFVSIIIGIVIILASLISPVLTVVAAVLALIPALIFGSISFQIVIFIAVMAGITIHFMKKSE